MLARRQRLTSRYPLALPGGAVSSAILYLAIVAIWAVILVPLLLRRSHDGSGAAGDGSETAAGSAADGAAHSDGGVHADGTTSSAAGGYADGAVHADGMVHEHGVSVEHGVAFEYDTVFEYGEARSGSSAVEYQTAVEYESAVEFDVVHDDRGSASDDAGSPDDDEVEPALTLRGRPLWSEGPGWHPLRRPDRPHPVVTRAAALRARRRMLTMLVTLTVVMVMLAAERLAPAWMIVPPVGMLGILTLLLHEAARADAEAAESRAAAHAARQARLATSPRAAREAEAAAVPERTAKIIDISARVGDQLYDQYADAAVRAVGD
jgi:hypothetical protein